MRAAAPALAITGLLVACGGPEPGAASSFGVGSGPGVGPGSTAEGSSTTGAAPGSSTGSGPEDSSTAGAGESSTTDLLRDVGGADFGDGQPVGCKGKIDFLFLISRSDLMEGIQTRLIDAFPKFIATIESKFADFDYHIMVVDGDEWWGWPICTADCPGLGCKVGDACCPVKTGCVNDVCVEIGDPCCEVDDYPCDLVEHLTQCDETLGAGSVFNGGEQASNKLCGVVGGRRYLTREQPDPTEAFSCIAQVGLSGHYKLAEAMTRALSPEFNGPGGCNEGFLRDDALLMVTFLSTAADGESEGKPKLWAEAALAAKHGDPNAVVMFGLAQLPCTPEDRICDLVQWYFPRWSLGNVHDEDYGPAFEVATGKVVEACSEFIPQ